MDAIILAGGFGTRLKSVVADVPKPMAPINGKPFLEILLSDLAKKGFTKAILSVGYMSEKIVGYFGDSFAGMELVYEIEETPLGTGGAICAAIKHSYADHAYVFNGDTYIGLDTEEVERIWSRKKCPIIVTRFVKDTDRFGRVVAKDGQVIAFNEKTGAGEGLINAGCYVLYRDVFQKYGFQGSFSFESDFVDTLIAGEYVCSYQSDGKFIDIGVPDDYARAQVELACI